MFCLPPQSMATLFANHVHARRYDGQYFPVNSSLQASRLLSGIHGFAPGKVESKLDYWDKMFIHTQELVQIFDESDDIVVEKRDLLERLLHMIISRDEQVLSLARRYLSLEDIMEIRNRLIGSGFIGGKTVGMLLARKILSLNDSYDWSNWLEPHDSFFIGSDVYYTYLVENGAWEMRVEQKREENYFALAGDLKNIILHGIFPRVYPSPVLSNYRVLWPIAHYC